MSPSVKIRRGHARIALFEWSDELPRFVPVGVCYRLSGRMPQGGRSRGQRPELAEALGKRYNTWDS